MRGIIAHISDFHMGSSLFSEDLLRAAIKEVNELGPDVLIISGDLTETGFYHEYEEVLPYLELIEPPRMIIPGNHDARNVGDETFLNLVGKTPTRLDVDDKFSILGLDSTMADLNEGQIGKVQRDWLACELGKIEEEVCKVVVMHHHLLPVPGSGRERNMLYDAGDLIELLLENGADLALCGHKHVPNSWIIENLAVVNAGTVCTRKLRGRDRPSYNVIEITEAQVTVELHDTGGKKHILARYKERADVPEYVLERAERKKRRD